MVREGDQLCEVIARGSQILGMMDKWLLIRGCLLRSFDVFCYFDRIDMGSDQTVELSDAGYQFLIDLFHNHDKVCEWFIKNL